MVSSCNWASSVPSLQSCTKLFLGRPLLRLPSDVQGTAILAMLLLAPRITCPIHRHLLLVTSVRHTLNQILIKCMKASYLNQFVSEMIDSWQQDSTWCTLQFEIINYVTMATYWVPDLPNVSGFSGFFWGPILIFFGDAFFARSSKHINVFKVDFLSWLNFSRQKSTKMLKTTGRTGKESVAMVTKFNYIFKCVIFWNYEFTKFQWFLR